MRAPDVAALRRVAPGPVYAALLVAGTLTLRAQPTGRQLRWQDWASTSVANLEHEPVGPMVVSALFADGDLLAWAVLAAVGIGCLCRLAGPARAVLLCAAGHVVGTLVSEGIVAVRVATGDLPDGARHLLDLGPSYVVVSALVGCALYGRRAVRWVGVAGFAVLAPSLFGGLFALEVSAVGHVTAITVAAGLGWWLVRDPGVPRR